MPETNPQDDELLRQLNGDPSAMPPFVDPVADPEPPREAQLAVPAPLVPPAVQRADAVHATKAGGAGYRVDVIGEYYALASADASKGKVKRPYELSFNLPRLEAALSVIKNRLLGPALRRKYPDAVGDRTCQIVRAVPLDPTRTPQSNNLAFMDRPGLDAYVLGASPKPPIDTASYPRTDAGTAHLREAIIDWVQNPDGFDKREAERRRQRLEDAELAALNPELAVGA